MKTYIALFLMVLCSHALAVNFTCEATYNADVIMKQDVRLLSNERNNAFAETEEFIFYLSDKGKNVFELQTLHIQEPTRSYATAHITAPGQFIQLSIWKRDYLLELICTAK